jgi:hypothetical protein
MTCSFSVSTTCLAGPTASTHCYGVYSALLFPAAMNR